VTPISSESPSITFAAPVIGSAGGAQEHSSAVAATMPMTHARNEGNSLVFISFRIG
jgi:hypothetical protein